jgi:hypothetical protein
MSISPRAPEPGAYELRLTFLARREGELLEGGLLVIGLAQMVQDAVIAQGEAGFTLSRSTMPPMLGTARRSRASRLMAIVGTSASMVATPSASMVKASSLKRGPIRFSLRSAPNAVLWEIFLLGSLNAVWPGRVDRHQIQA